MQELKIPKTQILTTNNPYVSPAMQKVIDDSILAMVNKINDEKANALDKFIFDQFARHGYSKREALDLMGSGRLVKDVFGSRADIYILDGKPLFLIIQDEIWNTHEDMGDGKYSMSINYSCMDLSEPVVKEETNDSTNNEPT